MVKRSTVAIGAVAALGAIGVAIGLSRGGGGPPPGTISISATPTSLPDTGGDVTVDVTAQNIAAGTNMTLYANGISVVSAALPTNGMMQFIWTAPPNETTNPITDSLLVKSG